MPLRTTVGEMQRVLDNVMMVFTFVFYYKILSALKYFVKKYLTSIMNTI